MKGSLLYNILNQKQAIHHWPKQLLHAIFLLVFLAPWVLNANNGDPKSPVIHRTPTIRLMDAPPAADLDQYRNGSAANPETNCHNWVNGNLNEQQAHYVEGWSVPYRAVMTDLPMNTSITIMIGYDIKHNGKHALDYLTHFDYMLPHGLCSHGDPECVNPALIANSGDPIPGISGTMTTFQIPEPDDTNSPVPGQPVTSFNNHPATYMTLYGGTITDIQYVTNGDLNAATSETTVNITFEVDGETAVLAWGGHIASREDWGYDINGEPMSAGGISGSPYHMRLHGWTLNNLGQQDRSLQSAGVIPFCNISGTAEVCVGTTNEYCADEVTGQTYVWSVSSGDAVIVGSNTGACVSVEAGTEDFELTAQTTSASGICTSCSYSVDVLANLIACSIDGPDAVCPGAESQYCAPDGATSYTWTVSGDASISGADNEQCVTVVADITCGGSYSVALVIENNGCSSDCSMDASVSDDDAPEFTTCPDGYQVQCVSDIPECNVDDVSVSDNCDNDVTVSCSSSGLQGGACGGTVTLTYVAEDDCGHSAECVQVITVNDDTAPEITCPDRKDLLCGESNLPPNTGEPTANDNCDANLTVTYSDSDANAGCGSETGALFVRTWTATDDCGNTSNCEQIITCGPCINVCALTQGFYGSTNGQFYYNGSNRTALQLITIALTNSGPMVLGSPAPGGGGSLTVPVSAASCLNSLMPGGGASKVFPSDLALTSACSVPTAWKKNGKFASVLWGQAVTLWLNAKLFSSFKNLNLSNACISKPSFITANTVSELLTYTSGVLGGSPALSNGDLGLLAGYLGDLHNYFDECEFACGYYYTGGKPAIHDPVFNDVPVRHSNNTDFVVAPNPMWENFTVTLDPSALGKQVQIRVFNLVGEQVMSQSFSSLGEEQIQLSAATLHAGVYQIQVAVNNGIPESQTIVVIKP